jgi:1-acyl-sn-glycerol-3-phosphate acyltransferase
MHRVIIEEKYQFVPPHEGTLWSTLFRAVAPWWARRQYGVERVECRGVEHLRASIQAGHGILLTANHCRPSDPVVLGCLAREAHTHLFIIASWHLFKKSRFASWYLRRGGAFSIYREGVDKQALKTAIDILSHATRPLVIFPEGVVTRANDLLETFMEGPAFIIRSAAKKRQQVAPGKRVVVHPVAIKYFFHGDLHATLTPVLTDIEQRLSWLPQDHLSLERRILKIGSALLALKEIEYLGTPQEGGLGPRLRRTIDAIIEPIEAEWLHGKPPTTRDVVARVKRLRVLILPEMIEGTIDTAERRRRWKQLADLYIAQQMSHYAPGYIFKTRAPERKLETVERFEEDLTDDCTIHRPMSAIVQVGEAIAVDPGRSSSRDADAFMETIRDRIGAMLAELSKRL